MSDRKKNDTSPPRVTFNPIAAFGNLKVRPKFMVLHNLFFLVLAASVYFSLIPRFESHVASAKTREISLLTRLFLENQSLQFPGIEIYNYQEGSSSDLNLPQEAITWLELRPGQIYRDNDLNRMYRLIPETGRFASLDVPTLFYDSVVYRAKLTIFVVLGLLYALAILILELWIMPRYVYGPIQKSLEADAAIQLGDRQKELIPDSSIWGDEIGRIMRSRNATVTQLRKHEQDLENTLVELEATASELKLKNEQLEAARQSLIDQDRLASLGLLSASVAHELNTPLAVLSGSIEKLHETAESPLARERLERMLRVARRLRTISESLLDFARVRPPEMKQVQVREIVDEAWSLLAIDEKSSQVEFINRIEPTVVIQGNPDRLVQVFVNLLRNALNAVHSDGKIEAVSRSQTDGSKCWVFTAIEDNGPGIPADVLPEIFEAFVTTRLDSRGTGLGLTVAEGIITQHGGGITASNRPGGGARLEVKLPAAS